MRRRHFDSLRPVCPVCRTGNDKGFVLRLAHAQREEEGHILEGALHCTNADCLREYPIVDGIPLIVTNIRQYVSDNILPICARRDLSDFAESMLGDCCGPNSAFDQTRQHLSSYAWDHYGDLDPAETSGEPRPGSMLRGLEAGLKAAGFGQAARPSPSRSRATEGLLSPTLSSKGGTKQAGARVGLLSPTHSSKGEGTKQAGAGQVRGQRSEVRGQRTDLDQSLLTSSATVRGSVIDVGCSVGRGSFALAERGTDLVLGVDLSFAILRVASEVLRQNVVRYPRRRAGLVYERREFPARFANMENVDFWACDASALPFPAGAFSLAVGMNVLDCAQVPRELLVSLARVLKEGGKAVLTCPYDWSPAATPPEAWLGGHSQRSPMAGSCEAVLRALLTPGAHPGSVNTLKLIVERENLPWQVRLHERSTMAYKVHLVVAERVAEK